MRRGGVDGEADGAAALLDPAFSRDDTLRTPHPRIAENRRLRAGHAERRGLSRPVERLNRRAKSENWRVDVVTPTTVAPADRMSGAGTCVLAGKNGGRPGRSVACTRPAFTCWPQPCCARRRSVTSARASSRHVRRRSRSDHERPSRRCDSCSHPRLAPSPCSAIFGRGVAREQGGSHLEKLVDGARYDGVVGLRLRVPGTCGRHSDAPGGPGEWLTTADCDSRRRRRTRATVDAAPTRHAREWATRVPLDSFRRMTGRRA